ncbi:3-keto-disaccharide hydrolase [Mucilaginibacter phyllosphaerae]
MKKLFLSALAVAALQYTTMAQTKTLFDGKTTTGWHTYLGKTAGPWSVVDGALQLDPNAEGQADLVTDGEYENYELSIDWKIAEGGNSGIIFGVHEDPSLGATYLSGIEMQVLDNVKAEDNKKPTHLAGSLYDLKAAPADAAKPAGEWNKVKLRNDKGHLIFWLNGKEVINVQIGSPEWTELLNNSKFKTWKAFAAYPKGHIALQSHGAVVAYKNIKIKQL